MADREALEAELGALQEELKLVERERDQLQGQINRLAQRLWAMDQAATQPPLFPERQEARA